MLCLGAMFSAHAVKKNSNPVYRFYEVMILVLFFFTWNLCSLHKLKTAEDIVTKLDKNLNSSDDAHRTEFLFSFFVEFYAPL